MMFVAIVGRSKPKTGGEFYNEHALAGLSEMLGSPLVLDLTKIPPWNGWLNRPVTRPYYYLAVNIWFFLKLLRLHPKNCYIDFFMFRFLWLFRLSGRFRKAESLVVVHDLYHVLLPVGFRRKFMLWLQRTFLTGCTYLVSTSRDTARRLAEEVGLDDKTVHVIPPGLDNAIIPSKPNKHEFSPRQRDRVPRILFVGMIIEEKGVLDLVLSQKQLFKDGVKTEVHFAGRYDIDPEYTNRVREAAGGNKEHLVFHGFLSKPALHALYRSCDIFVLPSYYETFGMVLLEAMQFGLPIVATNQGGVPDIVENGATGLLYTPGDVNGLTECLRRLVEDKSLRLRLAKAGQKRVRDLPGWDRVRSAFQDILRDEVCI